MVKLRALRIISSSPFLAHLAWALIPATPGEQSKKDPLQWERRPDLFLSNDSFFIRLFCFIML